MVCFAFSVVTSQFLCLIFVLFLLRGAAHHVSWWSNQSVCWSWALNTTFQIIFIRNRSNLMRSRPLEQVLHKDSDTSVYDKQPDGINARPRILLSCFEVLVLVKTSWFYKYFFLYRTWKSLSIPVDLNERLTIHQAQRPCWLKGHSTLNSLRCWSHTPERYTDTSL